MFEGTGTALVTPFTKDGIDFSALENLIEFQIKNGVNYLVILGTTGEPTTMTLEEKILVIDFTIKKVAGRCKVIVGAGSNSTMHAIELCKLAEEHKADGVLVVTPYYNKANQEGIYQHYAAIAKSITTPIICYNVPCRTAVNMLPETFKRLISEFKNIVAIKEASGNMQQIIEYVVTTTNSHAIVLSGDDFLTVPAISIGAKGIISVTSNIIPNLISIMTNAALSGDFKTAGEIQLQIQPLVSAMFCDVNPIPVKKATQLMKLTNGIVRLPLTELSAEKTSMLNKIMKEFKLC